MFINQRSCLNFSCHTAFTVCVSGDNKAPALFSFCLFPLQHGAVLSLLSAHVRKTSHCMFHHVMKMNMPQAHSDNKQHHSWFSDVYIYIFFTHDRFNIKQQHLIYSQNRELLLLTLLSCVYHSPLWALPSGGG